MDMDGLTRFANASLLQHIYMAFGVTGARKKYGVRYPAMYADESTKDGHAFNCVQRGHQNSLENLATFNALLILAGLRFPVPAAVAGAAYLIGRIVYFKGYCESPKGRMKGGFMHLGTLALVGMVGYWAVELIRS